MNILLKLQTVTLLATLVSLSAQAEAASTLLPPNTTCNVEAIVSTKNQGTSDSVSLNIKTGFKTLQGDESLSLSAVFGAGLPDKAYKVEMFGAAVTPALKKAALETMRKVAKQNQLSLSRGSDGRLTVEAVVNRTEIAAFGEENVALKWATPTFEQSKQDHSSPGAIEVRINCAR